MKKLMLTMVISLMSLPVLIAQNTSFGLTAGYLNVDVGAKYQGVSSSVSESGFYIGAFADIALTPVIHLQPGINYGFIEDSGIIYVPVMAKIYIADSGFSLQAGPQASILTEDTGDEVKAFGLDVGLGAAYDINSNFFVEARYSLELTNRLTSEFTNVYGDISSKINSLFIGVGYKF